MGSVEPPRPLQPAMVKVMGGRPYGLLCCMVQGLVAHAELSCRNCSEPLKVQSRGIWQNDASASFCQIHLTVAWP